MCLYRPLEGLPSKAGQSVFLAHPTTIRASTAGYFFKDDHPMNRKLAFFFPSRHISKRSIYIGLKKMAETPTTYEGIVQSRSPNPSLQPSTDTANKHTIQIPSA